jgi:C1A family cysteine protease
MMPLVLLAVRAAASAESRHLYGREHRMPAYRIRRFGYLPDPYDHRDLGPRSSRVGKALRASASRSGGVLKKSGPARTPAKVDLRKHFPAIEDQGEIGSCTAHAIVGLLECLWKQTAGENIDASRLFVYKTTRNLLGWQGDSGAFIRTAIKAVRLFGVCPEDYWDYDEAEFDSEPPAFCYSFARNYRSLVYYRLPEKVADLKKSLAQGIPFAFGFTCFESIDNEEVVDTGRIPFPERGEHTVGGHAVVAVGYDDRAGSFVIRNSWGRSWGDKGYGMLPYKYFEEKLADDCWCILKSEYEALDDVE